MARRARTGSGRPARGEIERLHGIHPVLEALRAGRRRLHRLQLREEPRGAALSEIVERARAASIPVERVSPEAIQARAPQGVNPQGVVLEAGPLPEGSLGDLCAGGSGIRTVVALDGVEDPQNMGAIARIAEAVGARGLLITRRRGAPLSPAASRASAGALEWLQVARVPNLSRALTQLKDKGFWIFGCDPQGPLDVFELPPRLLEGDRVVVLGAEGRGLRPGVRGVLDHHLRIPMTGRVASLNVSAAAAVVLFELARRTGLATTR